MPHTVNPGFDPTDVLIAEVPLSNDLPGGVRRQDALIVEIGQRVAELGGVDSAGWSSHRPARDDVERTLPRRARGRARRRAGRVGGGEPARAGLVPRGAGAADRRPRLQLERWARVAAAWPSSTKRSRAAFWNGDAVGRTLRYRFATRRDRRRRPATASTWSIGETIAPQVYLALRQSLEGMTPTLHVRYGGRQGNRRAAARRRSDRWRPGSCRVSGRCAMPSRLRSCRRGSPRSSPGPSAFSARSSP